MSNNFIDILADSLSRSDIIEITLSNKIVYAIMQYRVEKGMSRKDFAEYMGVSPATVSKWESGDYNFNIKTLSQLCEKLELFPVLDIVPTPYWKEVQEAHLKISDSEVQRIKRLVDNGILPPIPNDNTKACRKWIEVV